MFLDASAIVGVVGDEEDADHLFARIEAAQGRLFYSPLAAYEAVVGYARKKTRVKEKPIEPYLVEGAQELVGEFLSAVGAVEIAITSEIGREAIAAYKRYGRGVGHPAKLNLGDCFAYACARSNRLPLLFKGDDFPHTDIERA